MELEQRLKNQWIEVVEDWIQQNQAVRTGMLDLWMLSALGDVAGFMHLGSPRPELLGLIKGLRPIHQET